MGVFEFLTISIVALASASVVKTWLKTKAQRARIAHLEGEVLRLQAHGVEERLRVIEEIVTDTDLERQFARLSA